MLDYRTLVKPLFAAALAMGSFSGCSQPSQQVAQSREARPAALVGANGAEEAGQKAEPSHGVGYGRSRSHYDHHD